MQHIPDERDLRNLLLTISYDGRQFHGWQIQQNAYTVQEAFQTALTKIIGEGFDLKGCSRTDTGVHANMYCISLKTTHPIPPERLISTRYGTARFALRFWRATRFITDIRSTKSC